MEIKTQRKDGSKRGDRDEVEQVRRSREGKRHRKRG